MSIEEMAIAYLFDRIPALHELKGFPRLEAEEEIRNAVADVIGEYIADCDSASGGGAP